MTDTELRGSTSATHTDGPGAGRMMAPALFALGVGAMLVALLGPVGLDVIHYHVSAGAVTQVIGGDLVALVLVGPVALWAGALLRRGHRAGNVLALGPAAYVLYTYMQLAVGGDVDRYPGNSELFFPLLIVLFVVAGYITLEAWKAIEGEALPHTTKRTDRFLGGFLIAAAAFLLVGLHLPGLIDVWSGQVSMPEYLADPVVFWLVKFMDLAIVVPSLAAIGIGSFRDAGWAHKAKYAAVGWFGMLGSSVAGMAIAMQLNDDPAASVANTLAFSFFAIAVCAVAAVVYRPLFRES